MLTTQLILILGQPLCYTAETDSKCHAF